MAFYIQLFCLPRWDKTDNVIFLQARDSFGSIDVVVHQIGISDHTFIMIHHLISIEPRSNRETQSQYHHLAM